MIAYGTDYSCPHGEPLGDCLPCRPKSSRQLVWTTADGIAMASPRWLWHLRIPTGAITLLPGREGIGKSTVAYDLVAKVTRGQLLGEYEGIPCSVAVVAGEDSWSCVIVPRLVAAGAELSRVYRVDALTEDGHADSVSLPVDHVRLTEVVTTRGIVLVVLDPLMSVISGVLDTHKDRDVRQALDPLARMASTTDAAVLGLIHVNKGQGNDPGNAVMASRAFPAVARSILFCVVDPEAERQDRYLFGHVKSNLGPKQPTQKYHLVEVKLEAVQPPITTSRVIWDGEDDRTISEAMAGSGTAQRGADSELTLDIVEYLREADRPVPVRELAASMPKIKRNTLDQQLKRLVERGRLVRPIFGHYALPSKSDSPPVPGQMSAESDLSDPDAETDKTNGDLTDLTDLRSDKTGYGVSDPDRGV